MALPPTSSPSATDPHAGQTAPEADGEKSLLLVKLGAIGDVVMVIPAAFEMHRSGFRVTWVCGEAVAPLLRLYPWIEVIAVEERTLLQGSRPRRLHALLGLWRSLRWRRFDLCATLYYDRRYRLLTLPVRARRRMLLSRLDRNACLLPGRHHTDEYARLLTGRPDTETPRQLPPVPIQGLPANPLPRNESRRRVVLLPGGARNLLRDDALRRWPAESYVELAAALLAGGHEVVLAGGPGDRWASPLFASPQLASFQFTSSQSSAPAVTDLIGQLSLLETLALLDSADLSVMHDTGPLHLAGLTRTAIVSIFGPTDPHGRLPQRAGCVALWGGEGFACRPCYDGRDYAPCPHNGCIRQVTPALVLGEIDAWLRALATGSPLPPPCIKTPEHTPAIQFGPAIAAAVAQPPQPPSQP